MRWLLLVLVVGCASQPEVQPTQPAEKQPEQGSFSSHFPDWLR